MTSRGIKRKVKQKENIRAAVAAERQRCIVIVTSEWARHGLRNSACNSYAKYAMQSLEAIEKALQNGENYMTPAISSWVQAERARCARIARFGMHSPNEDDGGYACDCGECAVRVEIAAKIEAGE